MAFFPCPKCHKVVDVSVKLAGRKVECPLCRAELLVAAKCRAIKEVEKPILAEICDEAKSLTKPTRTGAIREDVTEITPRILAIILACAFGLLALVFLSNVASGESVSRSFGASVLVAFVVPFLVIGVGIYVAPSIVAYQRGHANLFPIIVVNVLLGWTLLGWTAAMAWALLNLKGSRQKTRMAW